MHRRQPGQLHADGELMRRLSRPPRRLAAVLASRRARPVSGSGGGLGARARGARAYRPPAATGRGCAGKPARARRRRSRAAPWSSGPRSTRPGVRAGLDRRAARPRRAPRRLELVLPEGAFLVGAADASCRTGRHPGHRAPGGAVPRPTARSDLVVRLARASSGDRRPRCASSLRASGRSSRGRRRGAGVRSPGTVLQGTPARRRSRALRARPSATRPRRAGCSLPRLARRAVGVAAKVRPARARARRRSAAATRERRRVAKRSAPVVHEAAQETLAVLEARPEAGHRVERRRARGAARARSTARHGSRSAGGRRGAGVGSDGSEPRERTRTGSTPGTRSNAPRVRAERRARDRQRARAREVRVEGLAREEEPQDLAGPLDDRVEARLAPDPLDREGRPRRAPSARPPVS